MTDVPHTCCTIREGVYWICIDCHPGKIAPAYAMEALCDKHLEAQLKNATHSFRSVDYATEADLSTTETQEENGTETSVSTATVMETRRVRFLRILDLWFSRYFPRLMGYRKTVYPTYRRRALVPEQCPVCAAKPPKVDANTFDGLLKAHYTGWQIGFEWWPFWPMFHWTTHCGDCEFSRQMLNPAPLISKAKSYDWKGGEIRVPFGRKE